MPRPAQRLSNLPPYPLALLNQRVRELTSRGIDIVNLDVGSPDMPPPDVVIEALAESARQPSHHGYSGYKGTPEFRAAIAEYYQRRFGVSVEPERQVLPLLGSKEGLVNLCIAYLDRGDSALVPDVGYPSYSLGVYLAGGQVCWLPVRQESGYLIDFDAIPADALQSAKLVWVNYPNNPTGASADLDFYQRAVDFCNQHGLLLASDNPYVDVTYDGYVAGSALQARDAVACTLEFISFSKTYNMAGWRLGAAVGSPEAISTLLQVKSNLDSGHFRPVFDAAVTAIHEVPQAWIDQRNAIYQRRGDALLAALPQIGLEAVKPKGALYVWARVAEGDGASYAEAALNHAHVSFAPGIIYGPGGKDYVRMSISIADARLAEAIDRLKNWYGSR